MTEVARNAASTFTKLYAAASGLIAAWPSFVAGLLCGLALGLTIAWVTFRRQRGVAGRVGFGRALLALAPAVVACLLWGLWLGILAAKSLAR